MTDLLEKTYQIHISQGNAKIDMTSNISISPIHVCSNLPCYKICYARQPWECYPIVRTQWDENLEFFRNDPTGYFDAIFKVIKEKEFKYFRWHVGGEIVNNEYFEGMKTVSNYCKKTHFLCFTKRYHLHNQECPRNLSLVFSSHPEMDIPQEIIDNHPIAWMDDGNDPRIHTIGKRPFVCKSHCADCRKCWKLKSIKRDVIFKIHGSRGQKGKKKVK